MSNNSSSSSLDSAIIYSAISASILGTSLLAAQSDYLSRKFLSPLKLYARRRQEQIYKIDKAIAESIQRIRYHVNEGNYIDSNIEKSVVDLVIDKDEILTLVKDIIASSSSSSSRRSTTSDISSSSSTTSPPLIVGISKDLSMAKEQYYIHLAFPYPSTAQEKNNDGSSSTVQHYNRRVQVPLLTFCQTLSQEFESVLTSNAMCFIADASSSLSSHVFTTLLQKCETSLQIPTVQEPAWMTIVAMLLRRKEISHMDGEKILYSLCRMESLKLQYEQRIGSKHKTVVFVLPGQGCTQMLLPVLQKLFPCERHVFAYDGCVDSVKRGLWMLSSLNKKNRRNVGVGNVPLVYSAMPRNISTTVPLMTMMKKLPQLPDLLAKLSRDVSSIVEAWISSVDALIVLKEKEKENMYTPFVCRMEFLLKGESGNAGNEERGRLALCNVLQYITGSRSRALDDATLDAAQSVLMDLRKEWRDEMAACKELSQDIRTEIEDCVFSHKMILIGDKTLPDTVIPKVEWSLKAAKKLTSCACCFPGEDGDEDGSQAGDEDNVVDEFAMSTVKSTSSSNARNGYVDGKSKFAFDPSVFTGMK